MQLNLMNMDADWAINPLEHKGIQAMGGGSGGDSYDAAYNARMATIAESMSEMGDEYFDFWKSGADVGHYETKENTTEGHYETRIIPGYSASDGRRGEGATQERTEEVWVPGETTTEQVWVVDEDKAGYRDMEQAQIDANIDLIGYEKELDSARIRQEMELLPGQTALTGEQIAAARELLPGQTALTGAQNADAMTAIGERAPVRAKFYDESLKGVDIDSRVNRAAADAAHAFMNSQGTLNRTMARQGVNPNSGRFAAMSTANSIDRAKAIGGAKTTARENAEQENFGRLQAAMGGGA